MLNEQLKLIRKKNKYTQQELSDILEIERSTYASYETGRNRPDISLLSAIAKVFGVSVDYIVSIDPQKEAEAYDIVLENKRKQGETIVSDLSKEEREVLAMYRICSNENKDKVKSLLISAKNEDLKNLK